MPDTIVFIPCCKTKKAGGGIAGQGIALTPNDLPNTCDSLEKGRKQIATHIKQANRHNQWINYQSKKTSAIYLYQGNIYNTLQPLIPEKLQEIEDGQLRLIIISAAYGIIDCQEPIQNYEARMIGRVATIWRNIGLVNIISDLLCTLKPLRVFGYFPGKPRRNFTGPKYRYFFTEGLRDACNNGLKLECGGCFYNSNGRKGAGAILGSLGRTLVAHNDNSLDCVFAENILQNGRTDGNVTISFDPICNAVE